MTVNGEITTRPPEIDAGLAAAALAVFAHRHEVVHLLYAATDEPDALTRIAALLRVDETTIARVLDQPFRWMLPQFRTELESIAAAPTHDLTPDHDLTSASGHDLTGEFSHDLTTAAGHELTDVPSASPATS